MSKRLKNFLKQIEDEFYDPSEEEMVYILNEVKRYILRGIIPQDKRAKQLAYKVVKFMKDLSSSRKYPTMPHPQWMAENPDGRCQPEDWEPSPDWKPEPLEPEPVKGRGKLHLVKKEED